MSDLYAWKNEYSVGNARIDEQHRKFFVMLNNLHAALSAGKGKEALTGILAEVVSYTYTHFSYEEAEMMRCAYPHYQQHKLIHDSFTSEAAKLQEKAKQGEIAVSIEVMTQLGSWLVNHITKEDIRYAPYLAKQKAA